MPHVRLAAPEDIQQVIDIHRSVIEIADWLLPEERTVAEFSKSIQGERIFLYADDEEEILGFISVWAEGSFIHHLYVRSNSQGRGIGSALLESLKVWLSKPWHLKCVAANTRALSFYLARGFQEVSIHSDGNPPYVLLRNSEA